MGLRRAGLAPRQQQRMPKHPPSIHSAPIGSPLTRPPSKRLLRTTPATAHIEAPALTQPSRPVDAPQVARLSAIGRVNKKRIAKASKPAQAAAPKAKGKK